MADIFILGQVMLPYVIGSVAISLAAALTLAWISRDVEND